ncbi:MAG: hypothetical protein E7650_01295 [Ruminococcaceae bacterium]|nr:hypothetical protein [Oscillospiraceae bacterium]
MSNLLRAGLARYLKNPLTALVAVASLIIGLFSGRNAVCTIDDVYLIALFIAFAAFISLFVGREHGEGGFRNKAVTGYTKGQIFCSEWLLHTAFCLAMLLLFLIGFAPLAHEVLSPVPAGMLALITLCLMMMTVTVVTLLCTLTLLVSQRAVSAILSVLLVVGLLFASYAIDAALTRPQYYLIQHYNEAGEFVSLQKIEDPRYVDGAARTLLTHLSYTLPLGQSEPLLESIAIWNYSNAEADHDFSWLKIIKFLPLYSLGLTTIIGSIGYVIFRRRDLK